MSPFAGSGLPPLVMQEGGAVDADADLNAMPMNEVAPLGSHQSPIGLERMVNAKGGAIQFVENGKCFLIKEDGQDHRFAGMPDDRKSLAGDRASENLVERAPEHACADAARRVAVGQIAVIAVKVAKGRRLDNEKLEARSSGSHEHGLQPSKEVQSQHKSRTAGWSKVAPVAPVAPVVP